MCVLGKEWYLMKARLELNQRASFFLKVLLPRLRIRLLSKGIHSLGFLLRCHGNRCKDGVVWTRGQGTVALAPSARVPDAGVRANRMKH